MKKPSFFSRFIVNAGLLGLSLGAFAQVEVVDLMFDPQLVGPDKLWSGTIMNQGQVAEVYLRAKLAQADGVVIAEAESTPFMLPNGTTVLSFQGIRSKNTRFGTSEAAHHFQSFGTLPSGRFQYCLQVLPVTVVEVGDRVCEEAISESLTIMDLVYPMDRDTVHETRPMLNWTTTEQPLEGNEVAFKLVLAPMRSGQAPQTALTTEKPVAYLLPVRSTTVIYPVDAVDLERGQWYAWQMSKLVAGRVVDRTEAWSFIVAPDPTVRVSKYVQIGKRAAGGTYRPVDGRIYFRYDEVYNGDVLKCAIREGSGHLVEPTVREDKAGGAGDNIKSQGLNEFELDLLPYHLKKGIYTLEVRNEKDALYSLKFIIE